MLAPYTVTVLLPSRDRKLWPYVPWEALKGPSKALDPLL
jgi:hypothetical protein